MGQQATVPESRLDLQMSTPRLVPGRLLLYGGRRLLVTSVQSSTAQTLSFAPAQTTGPALVDVQRRYHLFLTPLGWAIDFQQERLSVTVLTSLPAELVGVVLGTLPLRRRLTLQRLSKTIKRLVEQDPGAQHLLTLPPLEGFQGALARGDWEELLLWHERSPGLVLTEEEEQTPIGAAFALFRSHETEAGWEDPIHDWGWLLANPGHRLEVTRYLLRTHVYSFQDLLGAISETIKQGLLDTLQVIMDYVERKYPEALYLAAVRIAEEADQRGQQDIAAWLVEKFHTQAYFPELFRTMLSNAALARRWALFRYLLRAYPTLETPLAFVLYDIQRVSIPEVFRVIELAVTYGRPDILDALELQLQFATSHDLPILDRLVSYLPLGTRIPSQRVTLWRTLLERNGEERLVQWLDSHKW
jgi:hypothetical protein